MAMNFTLPRWRSFSWVVESWYVFLLFLGLAGLFFSLPWRPVDQVMFPGDITTFYAPGNSVVEDHQLHNSILSDAAMIYASRHEFVWRHLQQGSWPTYDPYILAGRPAGVGVIYLLLQFPGWFLDGIIGGFLINTVWQVALGAVFAYWLLRDWKVSRVAAITAATIWSFGQHQVVWYLFSAHLATQIWFPLILLFFRWLFRAPSWQNGALFSFSLIVAWLAGYTQGTIYLLLMLGLYFWFLVWRERVPRVAIIRKIGVFALALAVFFALAGHSVFSFATKIESGLRGQQAGQHTPACDVCTATGLATSIAVFVNPNMLGNNFSAEYFGPKNIVEFGRYVGLLPWLVLLAAALRRRWHSEAGFFVGVAALSWAIMHGFPIVTQLIYGVPFLNLGQSTRLITLVLLSAAIWTGLLFDRVTEPFQLPSWKQLLPLALPLLTTPIVLVALWLAPHGHYMVKMLLITGVVFLGYIVLFFLLGTKKPLMRLTKPLLAAFLFLELWFFLGNFNTFSDRRNVFPTTELTQWLQNQPGNYRILPSGTIYIPNTAGIYELPVINGYSTAIELDYLNWLQENFSQLESTYNGVLSLPAERNLAVDQLATKYILSETPSADPTLQLVATFSGVMVYENPQAWPHVWLAQDLNCELSECLRWPTTALPADITLHSFTQGMDVEVSSPQAGWMIFSERSHPNWQAHIDGQSQEIVSINPGLLAIRAPAGEHLVQLRYHRASTWLPTIPLYRFFPKMMNL